MVLENSDAASRKSAGCSLGFDDSLDQMEETSRFRIIQDFRTAIPSFAGRDSDGVQRLDTISSVLSKVVPLEIRLGLTNRGFPEAEAKQE